MLVTTDMIERVQFKAEHWIALRRDESQSGLHAGILREKCGIAYTAIEDEMILGCAGILSEGTSGVLWALLSDELKQRHPVWFVRTAKRLLLPVVKTLGLYRVEAIVDPGIETNCQWIEWMGFEREGWRRKAGEGGKDLVSYVLFP